MYIHKHWRKGQRSGYLAIGPLHIEASFLSKLYGAEIEYASEGLKFSLMLGLACLWVTFENIRSQGEDYEWGVRFFDEAVWLHFGNDPMSSSSTGKWWRKKSYRLSPVDFIFGSRQHSYGKLIELRDVEIPMPEKSYPAQVEILEEEWKRPRWPFKNVVRRAHVDIKGGVPHAGKWGEDATYSMTTQVGRRHPVEDAIGKVVASALGDRWRHSRDHRDTGAREAVQA